MIYETYLIESMDSHYTYTETVSYKGRMFLYKEHLQIEPD